MSDTLLGLLCLALTLLFYYASKWLYGKKRILPLMPLLLAPTLLLLLLATVLGQIESWPLVRGAITGLSAVAAGLVAGAGLRMGAGLTGHPLSLSVGVVASVVMAVGSTVLLARWLNLSELLQRSMAMRSITTPFAVEATRSVGGNADLTALFVVLTGVIGMAVGESVLTVLAIRSRLGKGAGFGASAHGAGTARAYQMGNEEGVVSSMVMMIAGIATVLLAPLLGRLFW